MSFLKQGVIFWPVGTGDSTTIVVNDSLVIQVDLHDMDAADDEDADVTPIIDRLEIGLPKLVNGRPYLAVFALTHADLDHCRGFGDLLDSGIHIGELWATPRIWREELAKDQPLCADAERFHQEAKRRVAATLEAVQAGRMPASGDRVRIIGHDEERADHQYGALPREYFTYPGESITTMDGHHVADSFEAFIHAPFKDDCAGPRNETSLAMQISLRLDDGTTDHLLLFGDLSHITIKKIFDYSEAKDRPERLFWNLMLSAHHCSRKVMYADDDAGEEELKRDILDQFEKHAGTHAQVIASSRPFRTADKPGDNPPHLLARDRYNEITDLSVICTGEYPSVEEPAPVVFIMARGVGFVLGQPEDLVAAERSSAEGYAPVLAKFGAMRFAVERVAPKPPAPYGVAAIGESLERVRGTAGAPATTVGFGA